MASSLVEYVPLPEEECPVVKKSIQDLNQPKLAQPAYSILDCTPLSTLNKCSYISYFHPCAKLALDLAFENAQVLFFYSYGGTSLRL